MPGRRRKTLSRSLLRLSRSDPEAFGDFYDAHYRRVLLFFTWRVADPEIAFDLMSETFATALDRRQQFRGRTTEEEEGWLFAIARSELSHYWRRGAVERSALARVGVGVPSLTDEDLDRIDELAGLEAVRQSLRDGLDSLPLDQRRAVELRIVEELSYESVAHAMSVSEDVARARVSRGLRTLRSHLGDLEPAGQGRA